MKKTNHNEKIITRCLYCYKSVEVAGHIKGMFFCRDNHGECRTKYNLEGAYKK